MPPRLPLATPTPDFAERHKRRLAEIAAYSIPLFRRQAGSDTPVKLATGWILRLASHWFLGTASHVFEELNFRGSPDSDLMLHVSAERIVPIGGNRSAATNEDVSVIELEPDVIQQGRGYWQPVSLFDFDDSDPTSIAGGVHFLFGYPLETMRFEPSSEHQAGEFTGRPFQALGLWNQQLAEDAGRQSEHYEFDHRRHLLLPLDSEATDETGRRVATPLLNGVSGAPIWRLFLDAAGDVVPLLAGVETTVLGKPPRYIRGTRLSIVAAVIDDLQPGLLAELSRISVVQIGRPRHDGDAP